MTTLDPPLSAPPLATAAAPRPLLKIRPRSGWIGINLRELWRFRDLLWSLVGRDLKLRYKQTALGVSWVVLQPIIAAGIFSLVFGLLAKMPDDATKGGKAIPYFVFSFGSLVAWNLFSNTLNKVSAILVGNSALVSKVYFPRLLLPLSGAVGVLVDTAVAGAMLIGLQIWKDIPCGPQVLLTPVFLGLFLAMALGVGMWAGALCVQYRDVATILPVALQFLMYASPVAYSASVVDKHPMLATIYYLNPMAGLLGAWRWSIMATPFPPMWSFVYATIMSLVMLLLGAMIFRRMERTFADVI